MHQLSFRPVSVTRFISKNTIEEGIYQIALEKLSLEREISSEGTGLILNSLGGIICDIATVVDLKFSFCRGRANGNEKRRQPFKKGAGHGGTQVFAAKKVNVRITKVTR